MDLHKIAILREQLGLTQSDLGDKVGITRQTIAVWERGERQPSVAQLNLIAKALNVALDIFFESNDSQTPTLLFRADNRQALTSLLKQQVQRKAEDYSFLEIGRAHV